MPSIPKTKTVFFYHHSLKKQAVVVYYYKRKNIWIAEVHRDKKASLYEFETLTQIKEKLQEEGYECIGMSYYGKNEDYRKKYCIMD